MRRALLTGLTLPLAPFIALGAAQTARPDLGDMLARVGAAVERYYARAQSIICVETVRIQSLGYDLVPDASMGRQLTYELRVYTAPINIRLPEQERQLLEKPADQ